MIHEHRYLAEPDIDIFTNESTTLMVRRLGAEVIGFTYRHPARGDIGLLWRNAQLESPPKFWKSHAPILFPIVGGIHDLRARTTDGTAVRFKKQHGFVRHSPLALLGKADSGDRLVLHYHLLADAATMALYPWRFELWVTYELTDNRLTQMIRVVNRDEKPLPFQVGWHPGFNTPFFDGTKEKCHLRLPAGELRRLRNDANCYLTGEVHTVSFAGDFPFTESELDRTYMFDLTATPPERRVVELLDPDESFGVRVGFPDYPHLGLWSDAGAPFICIEPWQGMDDAVVQEPFDKKFGMLSLPPGEERAFRASIEIVSR
ncbi:MAG: hypothetical protein GX444_13315 [Myxococcales bacterium]|nr:hypothetical protein [Myxococcales bacterium]